MWAKKERLTQIAKITFLEGYGLGNTIWFLQCKSQNQYLKKTSLKMSFSFYHDFSRYILS